MGSETYNQVTKEPYNPNNLTFSGNVDYYLSDKHIIGFGGRWNKRTSDRIASSKTIISDTNNSNVLFSENTKC